VNKILERILQLRVVAVPIQLSKKIVLPGFDGLPLYDVTVFFFKGISKGYITSRASAISFSFFLAIFPFLIFLFTIIPLIPIENFQQSLLALVQDFVPGSAYTTIRETVEDIVTRPHGSLMSVGFILSLYFATNGINSLMEGFNSTFHAIETRSFLKQRVISIQLMMIICFMLIIAIGLMSFGTSILNLILPSFITSSGFYFGAVIFLKWLIILADMFLSISFLYYFAPAKKKHFRFISAGASLATFLIIITTLGFNFYVDNFSKYNVLYGSIGTLLVVMLWIYVNSFSLLIGFELNASIQNAKSGSTDAVKKAR
jgi:membrane protein